MNVDNENIEPVTDLSLAPSYSNHCIQRRLNNDSGAGANAGSRIDMTYAATDPLSELVWSPQKGPSSVVLSPVLPSITAGRSTNDKPIDEDNIITFQTPFPMNCIVTGTDTSARSPRNDAGVMPVSDPSYEHRKVEDKSFAGTCGYVEEMNSVTGLSVQYINRNDDLTHYEGVDICGPNNIQVAEVAEAREDNFLNVLDDPEPDVAKVEPSSQNPISGCGDVGSGIQKSKMEFVLASDIHTKNECKAYDAQSLTSPAIRHDETASSSEKDNENMMKATDSPNVPPMGKLESTSENDLRTLAGENVYGAASKILVSESAHEGETSCHQEEEIYPEKAVPDKHSPTNSRIHRYRRKGKEKTLSDGDVNGRMPKEDNDSHESVESCNSTGLFSTSKKRLNFRQQLIVGSKRVKKQIQETPGSTSYMKQDSSFMNWISNMMKGFLKLKEDEAPSLTPTVAHHNHGHESPDQDFVTRSKSQDPGCKSMGFQSIFQSIYCPKKRVQEETTLNENYQTEAELPNNVFDINATPVGYHGENVNFCKQFLISNEKQNESTSANGAGLAMQPKISSVKIAASQENNKTDSMENKNSCNLVTGMEKEGTSHFPSLGKHKLNSAENICSEASSEKKASQNFGYRKDHLRSLWVTRFAPKSSGSSLNLDHHNVSSGGALDCSTDCMKLVPFSQNHVSSPSDHKIADARHHCADDPLIVMDKDLEKCATETEALAGFNRMKGHNDLKSIYKINPILPSLRLKNAEVMASLFARRLDALKHIMPSDAAENAGSATITCFFCGIKGHHLRDCSEITDAELEDLLQNFNTYNGTEGFCFCIRCFQFNHWAATCPSASSKGHHQTERCLSLANDCSPSRMQHNSRIEENPKLSDGKENQFQASGLQTVCDVNDSGIGTNLKLNWTSNEMKAADKMRSNENLIKKCVASSSGGNKLKESQIVPLCTFVSREILDVPKGIFDAVKMLRLSRSNILKWMNSKMSLLHLDGFFLRLRFGKWEGVGGTGYYVGCITGAQRQSPPGNSPHTIFVNVGGIKCLVESQYISNRDFLEDELTAWWSATTKSDGKLPSEEDLRLKLKERNMLGL